MTARQTVASYLVARVGWIKAMRVARLVTAWAMAEAVEETALGPGQFFNSGFNQMASEYSEAILYRDLKLFREVFPRFDTPHDFIVWGQLERQAKRASKSRDRGALGLAVMGVRVDGVRAC